MAGLSSGEMWRRLDRLLTRIFPDRQLVLRTEGRISYVRLGRRIQMTVAGLLLLAGGWTAYSTVGVVFHQEILAEKDNEIASARMAYRSLLSEVAEYQKKFASVASDLEDNHSTMLGLVEENAHLQQNLRTVASRLKKTRAERNQAALARENLKTDLARIEGKMQELASHNFSLKDHLEDTEGDLEEVIAERNQLLLSQRRMKRNIEGLEARLAGLQEAQQQSVQRLTDQTAVFIDSMEKVVELTGLDVDRLLKADKGLLSGQGGPFVEAKPDSLPGAELKAELTTLDAHLFRSESLRKLMNKLPLASPLDAFYVTSSYGKRRDPINGRWAMHYGLDLGGPRKSKVYATAPGVVKFAGWKGNYGKLVVIDHGAGLITRYGHLHKITVKKGQKVHFRQKIGLLGNTGRSTGVHLHYEVNFRRKPRNPMKFIKAGRYVFQEQGTHAN